MSACFIATCTLPAVEIVFIHAYDAEQSCQPHYDAIMLVLGEQAAPSEAAS